MDVHTRLEDNLGIILGQLTGWREVIGRGFGHKTLLEDVPAPVHGILDNGFQRCFLHHLFGRGKKSGKYTLYYTRGDARLFRSSRRRGDVGSSFLRIIRFFRDVYVRMYICIYWRRGRGILAHEEYNNNNPWKGIVRIARGRDAQRKAGGHQGNGTCTRPDTRYQMLTSRENHGRRHASVYTRKTLSLATEHGMFR